MEGEVSVCSFAQPKGAGRAMITMTSCPKEEEKTK